MSLSKYKKNRQFIANRVFTDREEPRAVFWKSYEKLVSNEKQFQVLAYHGIGGIGKTTLLHFLHQSVTQRLLEDKAKVRPILISMDAFEFGSPTEILIAIRKQLNIPTILFDYALITYWSAVGVAPLDMKKRFGSEDSIIWDIVEEVGGVSGVKIPLKIIRSVADRLKVKYYKTFRKFKFELEEIEQSPPIEISRRLPFYLGLALHDAFEQDGIRHLIFFDAYETMLKKLKTKAVTESADEWIREFIGSSEFGLFVMGSREQLQWESYNPEWQNYLHSVDLDILPYTEADQFLQMVPIDNSQIRDEIIKTAKGIPLYLDLCVNIFEQKISIGLEPESSDFKIPEHEVIDRFLRHLSDEEAELVKVLSAVHFFDYPLLSFLIKKLLIGYSTTKFNDFINKSFVLCIDSDNGLYKIHDSIRDYLFDGVANVSGQPSKLSIEVIRSTIEYLDVQKELYPLHLLERFFSQLTLLIGHVPYFTRNEIELFIELGHYLSDNGYWNEVIKLISSQKQQHQLKPAFDFIQAICLVWKGQLTQAHEIMRRLEISFQTMGRHEKMAEFIQANIIRLLGNYDQAETLYERLVDKVKIKYEDQKLKSKILRQWGDILYLRGRFKESVNVLDEVITYTSNNFEKAATIRTKGHVFRLNFLFDEAESLYREALVMLQEEKTEGLIGKAHTSLMETLCWSKPTEAITLASKAIQINEEQQGKIELGRIYAALAIAHVLNDKNLPIAKEYIDLAKNLQIETGYASGVLFAHIAEALVFMAEGDSDKINSALTKIEELTSQLKVYEYLKLPIYVYLNDQNKLKEYETKIDWLSREESVNRIEKLVMKLR